VIVGTTDTQTLTNKTLQTPNITSGLTLSGAAGTSGQVLTSQGAGVAPVWGAGGGANLQVFTSSGTWTKPAGAQFVMVELWGAGGGGGSGARWASGFDPRGGGGGGGGAYGFRVFQAADLGATESVTIGAGGTGGAAVTVNDTGGNFGTVGGNTTFGALLTMYGGSPGGAGTAGSGGEGGSGGGVLGGGQPSASGSTGHFGTGSSGAPSGFGGGQAEATRPLEVPRTKAGRVEAVAARTLALFRPAVAAAEHRGLQELAHWVVLYTQGQAALQEAGVKAGAVARRGMRLMLRRRMPHLVMALLQ
jgi:hypothetical protein